MKAATRLALHAELGSAISIHAAREGGDKRQHIDCYDLIISIHAAREGGDLERMLNSREIAKFQSTPPVKAATSYSNHTADNCNISIHAAREGGDGGNE